MAKKGNFLATVFFLKERKYITPNYIRISLENEHVHKYSKATLGVNNKIFIAPKGVNKVLLPEFDAEKKVWTTVEAHLTPHRRTYTHRGIDLKKKEIYIDFVVHAAAGPASDWAINAPIGAPLGVVMATDPHPLYIRNKEWYLLVGDATGLPVLSVILEDLPVEARGYAIIEVETEADVQPIETKSQVKIEWLINPSPGQNSSLGERAKQIVATCSHEPSKFGYVATEFATVKALRNYLRKEMRWTATELYAYSYWRYGKSETSSETDRRQEKNSIE